MNDKIISVTDAKIQFWICINNIKHDLFCHVYYVFIIYFENVCKINLIIEYPLKNKHLSAIDRLKQIWYIIQNDFRKIVGMMHEIIKKFWQVQSRNHDMIKNGSDMEENFLTV